MKSNTASMASAVFCFVACVLIVALGISPEPAMAAEAVAGESFSLAKLLLHVPDLLEAAGLIVMGASSIAALTPTPKDDSVLLWLRKGIDFLALNVWGARNTKAIKDPRTIR